MDKNRPVNLINSFNLVFNQQLNERTNDNAKVLRTHTSVEP